jgi:DNA-binding winged helix-turn-helix (wHTH) protein
MTPEEYFVALAETGEGITATEGALRRLAGRSPTPVEREEALAAADTLSATRRRLRARAAARQAHAVREEERPLGTVRVGGLEIDRCEVRVTYNGRPVALSRKEYELLCALAAEPRRVFTKHELLRDIWGYPAAARTRTLDAHTSRLRRRLDAAGAAGLVVNVRGVGYRLANRSAFAVAPGDQGAEPAKPASEIVQLLGQRRAA